MLAITFVYLIIGILLILFGPLARKLNIEITRINKDYKLRLEWGNKDFPAWKKTAYIVTLRSLGILFYPLLYMILLHDYYYENTLKGNKNPMNSDEDLLYFDKMGGAGKVSCSVCNTSNEVVCFIHNLDSWSNTGFQCQNCGQFHAIENALTNVELENCSCGGNLERDEPIFCPKCKSNKVTYHMSYIT